MFYLWSWQIKFYTYSYAGGVKVFFKKLYFSSNSVLNVLSKVSCIQKYCQQFLIEVDVALHQSKWHIDKCLFLRHFSDIALV